MEEFISHTSRIHIRFNDMDVYGHVNNAVYLTYFEEARKDLFNAIVKKTWSWSESGLIIASHSIDYKLPLELNDEAYITTFVSKVGRKSFTVGYRIFKKVEGKEAECTTGSTVVVCFDYVNKQTMEIPEEWKQRFTAAN